MLINFTPHNTNLQNKKYAFTGKLPVPNKVIDPKFDYYYVRTLIDEGNSLKQIADYYKESVRTIRNVLEHFNLKTLQSILIDSIKDKELLEALNSGKSQKEIAEQFFIDDPGALTPRIKKLGKSKVTQAKVDSIPNKEIINLIDSGMSIEAIAQHYNVSYQYIRNKMQQLGIKTLKQMKSEKEIPLDIVKMHLENGWTIGRIAKLIGVTSQRLSACMKENNLKTLTEKHRESDPPKEVVVQALQGVRTVAEIAKKLGVQYDRMVTILGRYKLSLPKIVFPEPKAISDVISKSPRLSVDEIAKELGVEGIAVDKVVNKEKINVWKSFSASSISARDRIEYIKYWLEQGDSPTQIGEIFGLSSERARDRINKLFEYYNKTEDLKGFSMKYKKSPSKELILEQIEVIKKSNFTKRDRQDCKYDSQRFLMKKLAKIFKISDMSIYTLINKNELNEIFVKESESLQKLYS